MRIRISQELKRGLKNSGIDAKNLYTAHDENCQPFEEIPADGRVWIRCTERVNETDKFAGWYPAHPHEFEVVNQ